MKRFIGTALLFICALPLQTCRSRTETPLPASQAAGDYVTFTILAGDFAYPEYSIELLRRIVDLHERHQVPLDIFLTTTMVDLFSSMAPDLLERLRSSSVVAVSYGVRPPKPYYENYDWLGLIGITADEQYATIMDYETHGLDLTTGRPTTESGGYHKLAGLMGYPPYIAGALPDSKLAGTVLAVFRDLGALFTVVHGRPVNLGETWEGLYIRPEHVDLKLFEHAGETGQSVIERALMGARENAGPDMPSFVGVKMHDDNFFAETSAWLTVYLGGDFSPPWDPGRKAALLTKEARDAMWALYESTVEYVASINGRVTPVNAPMISDMLSDTLPVTAGRGR